MNTGKHENTRKESRNNGEYTNYTEKRKKKEIKKIELIHDLTRRNTREHGKCTKRIPKPWGVHELHENKKSREKRAQP